jgi:hypothetical protein
MWCGSDRSERVVQQGHPVIRNAAQHPEHAEKGRTGSSISAGISAKQAVVADVASGWLGQELKDTSRSGMRALQISRGAWRSAKVRRGAPHMPPGASRQRVAACATVRYRRTLSCPWVIF